METERKKKPGYWVGVLVGIVAGVNIGLFIGVYLAYKHHLISLDVGDEARVRQGIVILNRLQTDDVARTKHFLTVLVAGDYLRQRGRNRSWILRHLYRDMGPDRLERFVSRESGGLPDLVREIQRQEGETNGPNEASHGTALPRRP